MSKIGIFIPISVLNDKELTNQERFILCEIIQLSELKRGCFAHNEHFANMFDTTKKSVSNTISNLTKKGYISTKIKGGSRNNIREITIHNSRITPPQKVDTPSTKSGETKENKTINKTINKSIRRYV